MQEIVTLIWLRRGNIPREDIVFNVVHDAMVQVVNTGRQAEEIAQNVSDPVVEDSVLLLEERPVRCKMKKQDVASVEEHELEHEMNKAEPHVAKVEHHASGWYCHHGLEANTKALV